MVGPDDPAHQGRETIRNFMVYFRVRMDEHMDTTAISDGLRDMVRPGEDLELTTSEL
jgi:hypothetical protein